MKEEDGKQAYAVYSKLISSRAWVPQNRHRVYIMAIRLMGRSSVPFKWPKTPRQPPDLSTIFDNASQSVKVDYDNYPLPAAGRSRDHVQDVLDKVKTYAKKTKTEPSEIAAIVDTGGSKVNWSINEAPTVTRTRGGSYAYWSLQHARYLEVKELLRLQGFTPENMDYSMLSKRSLGMAVGNSYSVPVIGALMRAAIAAAEAQ